MIANVPLHKAVMKILPKQRGNISGSSKLQLGGVEKVAVVGAFGIV